LHGLEQELQDNGPLSDRRDPGGSARRDRRDQRPDRNRPAVVRLALGGGRFQAQPHLRPAICACPDRRCRRRYHGCGRGNLRQHQRLRRRLCASCLRRPRRRRLSSAEGSRRGVTAAPATSFAYREESVMKRDRIVSLIAFPLLLLTAADIALANDLFILATGRRDPRIYAIDFNAALKRQNNNTSNAIVSRSKVHPDRLDGTPVGDPANIVLSQDRRTAY